MSNKLPSIPLPADTVEIDGNTIDIKSLSRSAVLQLAKFQGADGVNDADALEDFILAHGVGISLEDAHEWRSNTDPQIAGQVVEAILELSGLKSKNS
jgi:hypothetical protein